MGGLGALLCPSLCTPSSGRLGARMIINSPVKTSSEGRREKESSYLRAGRDFQGILDAFMSKGKLKPGVRK